jgi:hypothetical protein
MRSIFWRRCGATLLTLIAANAMAQADPPGRVGLLNFSAGSVAFSLAGDAEWTEAPANRPLTPGDRVYTDRSSRAELHAGAIALRMDAQTLAAIVALDDRTTRLLLSSGSMQVRV